MSPTDDAYCTRFTHSALDRRTVSEIQRKIIEKRERNSLSQLVHARNDKETIATWRLDLIRILQVFNVRSAGSVSTVADAPPPQTELALNTHNIVSDIHQNMSRSHEDTGDKNQAVSDTRTPPATKQTVSIVCTQIRSAISDITGPNITFPSRVRGEPPPSPPRVFFGRDELIGKIVGLTENLTPVALIGVGGIGKTSIALTVLHHDRIKRRFGEDRRFIRCDQFPATPAHFLAHLSGATGAGVENPEDLASLHPFLSSKEMVIVLDNAESILDPQGTSGREIYTIVEELSRLETVCLCITSRISTTPPDCETLITPTLSMEAACDTFYRIYKHDERSDSVNHILEWLDFHPLSITLLATVAHHNQWGTDRLGREWESRRTDILQTVHNESLAATIELSLASPMFQELGPDARELLGVVAFFPQGVDEKNIDWLFPTISNKTNVFDGLRILSLTYESNGFITMLSPLRDHLSPKDPKSSPLLYTAKERYFSRLSARVDPGIPGFEEGQWITSEDVNVEHLLDVFTSIDAESDDIWDTCANFMGHLYWHKKRLVTLGSRIEGLRDDHPSKPLCLIRLSRLFQSVGNEMERKRVLAHALKLYRERGDDKRVARTLRSLSDANRHLHLHKEGIRQVEEASEIHKRLGNTERETWCLKDLAHILYGDGQFDAAERAASCAIDLFPEKGDQYPVCQCHRILGNIYRSRGKKKKAIHHFETALGIASSFGWDNELFWIHNSLALLFSAQGRFDDAHAHVERAKSQAANNTYNLGCAMKLQAGFWHRQRRFDEAKSEVLGAIDLFEKLGAAKDSGACRELLWQVNEEVNNGELQVMLLPARINIIFQGRRTEWWRRQFQ